MIDFNFNICSIRIGRSSRVLVRWIGMLVQAIVLVYFCIKIFIFRTYIVFIHGAIWAPVLVLIRLRLGNRNHDLQLSRRSLPKLQLRRRRSAQRHGLVLILYQPFLMMLGFRTFSWFSIWSRSFEIVSQLVLLHPSPAAPWASTAAHVFFPILDVLACQILLTLHKTILTSDVLAVLLRLCPEVFLGRASGPLLPIL